MKRRERIMARFRKAAIAVQVLLFAVACGSAAGAFAAEGDGKPHIKIVSPLDKAWVTVDQINLAGAVVGEDVKSVAVKGVAVAGNGISVEGGGFGTLIKLKKGENVIEVSAGKLSASVKVFYDPKQQPKGYQRYYLHAGVKALDCKECHRFRRGKYDFTRNVPARSDCTTAKCHGNKMATQEYVHGPVGAGVCISCHNPHGSFRDNQLARDDRGMCMICHEAKEEEFNKKVVHAPVEDGCSSCHDPHQSPLRFQLKGKKGKAVSSLCFNCHDQTIFARKYQHGPVGVGDCIACHNAHASNSTKLLIAETAKGEVCFQCHADRRDSFNLKQVHAPVKEDCGKCHDPHSSDHKMQLHKEQNVLCKDCHQKLSPTVFKDIADAKFKHAPVDEGRCASCHRAHSSNYEPLLDNTMEKLCFKCHIELGDEVADSKFRHGPVQTGDCSACHSMIHGSTFPKLLGRAFPMNFYDAYSPTKYDLCFGCHNKDIARKQKTAELTNFRDGEYNLHFLHVNRQKGRTCTACHGAHASTQAKHIREEVPFGGWSYPIDFTKTKNGGTCVVGCHAPKTYDRVKPLMKLDS
ncbi:MAG: cytochrome c3 family protein [Desulfobulbaceae bacterium]|nr:cytochrome c3 family protein [Desulfobulbaceae bacterium]